MSKKKFQNIKIIDLLNNKEEFKTKKKQTFGITEVIVLIIVTCLLSLVTGFAVSRKLFFDNQSIKVETDDEQLEVLIQNYNYIVNNYFGTLDKKQLVDSAIKGMLSTIEDPHATYFDENDSNNFNIKLNGSYEGIGVEIYNDEDKNIIIYQVFDNSPASNSGLKSGDIIKSIDGESLKNTTTTDFVNLVKESSKSSFELVIEREGKEQTIKVQRANVILNSVDSRIINQDDKKIGYIGIYIFANNTYDQFKTALKKLEDSGIDSLIIDVRSNTGGHLTSVQDMLSLFLNSTHVIYKLQDKNGITDIYSKGTADKDYPIVFVTNEASASASEILVASLKENLGAKSVGKKTYGKGTAQELKTLPDGTQYKFTTQNWLTPKGDWIDGNGIIPDVEVEFNSDYYDNPIDSNDDQLQAAVNLLK